MGFGTEIIFIVALGFLLFGPKRLPVILGHVARAKAQLKHVTESVSNELNAPLEIIPQQPVDPHTQSGGKQ